MTVLHQTEVNGVRCFWVETGRPTLAALLLFRQGMADEPLTESGWLHMLEHLALHGRGGGALHVNGSVTTLHTSFNVHGPSAGVVDQLAGITAWLSDPTFREFERERGVLRAEAAMRGQGTGGRAFGWRYGAQGPGLLSHDEPGMGRATPELLAERARRVFARQNAVLVLDGPPPEGLTLTLPEGSLLDPPPAVPVEDTLPAAYVDEGGLVLSGVVTRSATATLAEAVLQRSLHERLRDGEGAAYAPWATYEPVDATHALLLGGSDVLPELLPRLADNVLQLVEALRLGEPPPAWIDEIVEARVQQMHDPYAATALAWRAAHFHLQRIEPQTHQEIIDELHAIDPTQVAATLHEFAETLLLGVPGKTTWDDQLPMLTFPEGPAQREGTTYRSADWPAHEERLTVGRERLELSVGDIARTVEIEDAAGLFVFGDGGRYLIGRDGWGIHVLPGAWRGWSDAVAELDAAVPAHLHLPQPAREGVSHQRLSFLRRWLTSVRRPANKVAIWSLVAALYVAILLIAVAVDVPGLGIGLAIGLTAFIQGVRKPGD